MDDEVVAAFAEQDKSIQQLQLQLKESEDRAEERGRKAHEELVKMMSDFMVQKESGGGGATVGSAGGAVPSDSSTHPGEERKRRYVKGAEDVDTTKGSVRPHRRRRKLELS